MRNVLALILLACCGVAAAGADIRTGVYRGRIVTFENVGGQAIYQGDIILGRTADIEADLAENGSGSGMQRRSVGVTDNLWPNGAVLYTIDSALSSTLKDRIQQAIAHWNTKTPVRWLEAGGSDANYVYFTSGTSTVACSSSVGMVGGKQSIKLPEPCDVGAIIHEMGHAVGLWHEQSRSDRNRYISVLYENIDLPSASNYDKEYDNAVDRGPYDFGSIMHYDATDFSRDGIAPAMESVPPGIPMGQRTGLSAGDIDAVRRMYGDVPTATTIATTPSGLKVVVDGQPAQDGDKFDWAPGSQHTVSACPDPSCIQADANDPSVRYVAASWSDGGNVSSHVFTASADQTVLIANFAQQYKIATSPNPAGSGTITISPASPDGWYTDRSNIYITATPSSGYNFVSWSVFPMRSLNPKWIAIRSDTGPIVANFSKQTVATITSTPPGVTMRVDGKAYTTPVNFTWTAGDTHTVAFDDAKDQPDFVHYKFDSWSDGGAQSHSVVASSDPATYTAKFIPQHEFWTRARRYTNASGSMSLSPTLDSAGTCAATTSSTCGFFDEGTQVQVTASPGDGSVLRSWYGDLGGNASPATVVVDGQKLVVGVFGTARQFTVVSAATSSDGLMTPSGEFTGNRGWVAPGQIVAIYSTQQIGPSNGQSGQIVNGKVTSSLAGVQVTFYRATVDANGTARVVPNSGVTAPILYAGANQINCIVPYAINTDATAVYINNNGQQFGPVWYDVASSAPGIFTANYTGRGPGAIQNEDYSLNTADNPADRGKVIVLYATGEGATVPAVADGTVNNAVFPKAALPVSVRIGGQPAVVEYAGALPTGVAGAFQINVRIPMGVVPGPKVPVSVVIGDNVSPVGVTVAVR